VADTGGGIPVEARDYIFETFRQVDGASTRQHGGVGLGLSIVRQLVELMKGKITLESELAKGSVFIATLPLMKHEGTSATVPL
jgi:signal transduction histidine kinase